MAAAADAILGSLQVLWQAKVQDTAGLVIYMRLADVCACPAGTHSSLQSEACHVHTVEGQALHQNRQSTTGGSLWLKAFSICFDCSPWLWSTILQVVHGCTDECAGG